MTPLIKLFVIFALAVHTESTGLVELSEADVIEIAETIFGVADTNGCEAPDEMRCVSDCGIECRKFLDCRDQLCSVCFTPYERAKCVLADKLVEIMKTGVIDFEGASVVTKFMASMPFSHASFCADGRLVCDEVEDGCVAFEDICDDHNPMDCVCDLGTAHRIASFILRSHKLFRE